MSGDGLLVLSERQHVGTHVLGKELLHVVVGCAHGAEVVEPDEVGTPLPSFLVGEERCIGGHVNHVGVALDASHKGCFVECTLKDVLSFRHGECGLRDVAGIFAGKHFRAFAVVVVVAGDVLGEPLLVAIVVLVYEVGFQPSHLFPSVAELLSALVVGFWPGASYNLDVRITGANGFHEMLQSFGIERSPLLVAYTDELEVEGCRMAHVGTQFAPLCVSTAVAELYEVEAIIDVGLQVAHSHMNAGCITVVVLILAGQTYVQNGQRFGSDVLGEAEHFVEAHAVALEIVGEETMGECVVPTVLIERTVLYLSYRVLPLIA